MQLRITSNTTTLANTEMPPNPNRTQSRSDSSFCQFQPDATSLSTVAAALEVRRGVSAFGSVSSSVGFWVSGVFGMVLDFEVLVESAFRERRDGAFPTFGQVLGTSFQAGTRKAQECRILCRSCGSRIFGLLVCGGLRLLVSGWIPLSWEEDDRAVRALSPS